MPPIVLLHHLLPDLLFSSSVTPDGPRMAAAAPGYTLFTELHAGAEKALRGGGWGRGLFTQEENRSQKLFVSHWSLLCCMQLIAEKMDWNKPLEVKDAGYFFDTLCT